MKIEKSSVEIIKEPNILKRMELAGRCCYNSQNKITEDSYEKFIKNVVKRGHLSVTEHSNIIVKFAEAEDIDDVIYEFEWALAQKAFTDARVHVTMENDETKHTYFVMISGNARAWIDFLSKENEYVVDADDVRLALYAAMKAQYPLLFTEDKGQPWNSGFEVVFLTESEAADINIDHTYYTFKITTSRDITHQIVRHRVLSFSQQSQRYCNYTLEKNDGEITYIEPRLEKGSDAYEDWVAECENIDSLYTKLIEDGYSPEVARCILPNCTKAIIYVSGHYADWQKFIALRTSDGAQEEIREIAENIDKEIKKCYN